MLEVKIKVFQKCFATMIQNPGGSSLTNVLTQNCHSLLYGPTDWKAAAWHLEEGNVHSVLYASGPANVVTQDWRTA